MEAVYIIHVREFINSKQDIYKIGRTSQAHTKRANSYPKGSCLEFQIRVEDSRDVEKQIIRCFKESFVQRLDIGMEYFEGNYIKMRQAMIKIVETYEGVYVESDDAVMGTVINDLRDEVLKMDIQIKILKSKLNVQDEIKEANDDDIQETDCTNAEKNISNRFCSTCQKTFNNKTNFTYHMNRLNPCVSPEFKKTPPIKNHQCSRCQATFQTKQNLSTHLTRQKPCKIINPNANKNELAAILEQFKTKLLHK